MSHRIPAVELAGISYAVDGAWPDRDGRGAVPAAVRRDLGAIRDELHCTAVLLFGADAERLAATAACALELGLHVWLQPRLEDRPRREVLAELAAAADAAEALRRAHPGRVTLAVGCEHSLFTPGLIPGPRVVLRLAMLRHVGRARLRRRLTRRLDALLAEAAAIARARFAGPLTYAAGYWEQVDWSRFDLVGVNLYRFAGNEATYAERVRALVAGAGKPVAVTEFGCCPHRGGDRSGPAGFRVVRWWAETPRLRDGVVRDETVQATYLNELLDVFEAAGVHAAFAFTFAMRDFPHRPDDPGHDLDTASFGVVKVSADDPSAWERKEAFGALAERYGRE